MFVMIIIRLYQRRKRLNIKRLKFYLNSYFKLNILLFIIFFIGCGHQNNIKLGQNYYKMALAEISDPKISKQHSYKKALFYLDNALSQEERPEFLAFKATLLFELGYSVLGEQFFDLALDRVKDSRLASEILNNKACLLAQSGMLNNENNKIDTAQNIWKDLELNKDYLTPEVSLFNQSKIFVYKNEYKLAQEKLEKAITIAPNYLDAHYYLALVSYNLSDIEYAKKEVETVLFLYPEHKSALRLKGILQNI